MAWDPAHVLAAIGSRRVVRHWSPRPVTEAEMHQVLRAARWAPAAGNRRLHRFVAVRDSLTIRLIRALSPGIAGHPTGVIVICIDWDRVNRLGNPSQPRTLYIDVGTVAQTMLLTAHAIGLGAGPVSSFSSAAVAMLLGLPKSLSPELLVCLGHPAPEQPVERVLADRPLRLKDLVISEHYAAPVASGRNPASEGGRTA